MVFELWLPGQSGARLVSSSLWPGHTLCDTAVAAPVSDMGAVSCSGVTTWHDVAEDRSMRERRRRHVQQRPSSERAPPSTACDRGLMPLTHAHEVYVVAEYLVTPAGFTEGGGPNGYYLRREKIAGLHRWGRWSHERTLGCYMQEAICARTERVVSASALRKVSALATLLPDILHAGGDEEAAAGSMCPCLRRGQPLPVNVSGAYRSG